MHPISYRRSIRVYPNGTMKKRPIRVGFQVLARSRLETDSNGTFADSPLNEGATSWKSDILKSVPRAKHHWKSVKKTICVMPRMRSNKMIN